VARDKLALHPSKAVRISGFQLMGWEPLILGAGENIMQWYLGGNLVGEKSPIEVQHAQKLMELTGGLGRVAVLEMGHLFF
jgi:hypothetical protein